MKLLRQIMKFGKSWAIWWINDKPCRDPELITHIFKTCCEPCVHYDPRTKECSICECPVSENVNERNKLLYATEYCPLPNPKFTAEITIGECQ